MSDTTGWSRDHDGDYSKTINNMTWYCQRRKGAYRLWFAGCQITFASRPTLRDCQRLAHATARLWAGDAE